MIERIKRYCEIAAASGNEEPLRQQIIADISDYCEPKIDGAGNILAFRKGKNRSARRLLIDAHMDEVGFCITSISDAGLLSFSAIGGINPSVLPAKRVRIGDVPGVIGIKPPHLSTTEEKKTYPSIDSLYIDIGASSKSEAEAMVSVGDTAVFDEPGFETETGIVYRALDDRIGCAILVELLREEPEYDFFASFSTGEEVGLRGARCAAFGIDPQDAIILETTTAADIKTTNDTEACCYLSKGPVVPFMDRATVYDHALFEAALNSGIKCQTKHTIAGGNNAGSVHLSRSGVRSIAVSVPCRYLHSPLCAADKSDILSAKDLARYLMNKIGAGDL